MQYKVLKEAAVQALNEWDEDSAERVRSHMMHKGNYRPAFKSFSELEDADREAQEDDMWREHQGPRPSERGETIPYSHKDNIPNTAGEIEADKQNAWGDKDWNSFKSYAHRRDSLQDSPRKMLYIAGGKVVKDRLEAMEYHLKDIQDKLGLPDDDPDIMAMRHEITEFKFEMADIDSKRKKDIIKRTTDSQIDTYLNKR